MSSWEVALVLWSGVCLFTLTWFTVHLAIDALCTCARELDIAGWWATFWWLVDG